VRLANAAAVHAHVAHARVRAVRAIVETTGVAAAATPAAVRAGPVVVRGTTTGVRVAHRTAGHPLAKGVPSAEALGPAVAMPVPNIVFAEICRIAGSIVPLNRACTFRRVQII
jgi:hypothetical protein